MIFHSNIWMASPYPDGKEYRIWVIWDVVWVNWFIWVVWALWAVWVRLTHTTQFSWGGGAPPPRLSNLHINSQICEFKKIFINFAE